MVKISKAAKVFISTAVLGGVFLTVSNSTSAVPTFLKQIVQPLDSNISVMQTFRASEWGGGGGRQFYMQVPSDAVGIDRIVMYGGSRLDSIKFVYLRQDNSKFTQEVGGGGGSRTCDITFDKGEYITSIQANTGAEVDKLIINTSRGQVCEAGGSGGGRRSYTAQPGEYIWGLFGREGELIDSVGALYNNQPPR